MTGLMLFGNLRSTWDATIQEHISTIVNRTFRKMSGEDYEKEVPRGFIDTWHTNYMKQLGQFFLGNYAARKQKVYMYSALMKPENISIKMMTARLKFINAYLPQYPFPANTPF